MGRNRANLDDNYFNLGLIGQEFNGKLGFWKSELCDSNTVFACVCKCVWIIAFVWDCMYVYMRVGMYVRVCVCVCVFAFLSSSVSLYWKAIVITIS